MYKLCKTEQSAARQRGLEQGLMDLMTSMQYEDISVSDLCQQLQIPRKAFYRYFSGKDGALHAMIDHTLLEYEAFGYAHKNHRRTVIGELTQFFAFWKRHGKLLNALSKSNLSGVLMERTIEYAISETVFPIRFLENEEVRMRGHVVQFTICGLMSMVLHWHQNGYCEDLEEMAAIAARLLEKPLFPDAWERLS